MAERQLSDREREQLEIKGYEAQNAVDDIDNKWPEVCAAAALAADCYKALRENEFEPDQAIKLVGPLMMYLR